MEPLTQDDGRSEDRSDEEGLDEEAQRILKKNLKKYKKAMDELAKR